MKFIIFALLFVGGAYAGISTVDHHVENIGSDPTFDNDDNQLILRAFGMGTLEKILELRNLAPAIMEAAKNISTLLQIGAIEALHLIIDTISSLLGIIPTLVKQIPEFGKNLPGMMKALPPIIDSFQILIEASPELMKALPPLIGALPSLAEKLVPTLQATPDLLTALPAVIDILPDLSNILQKLAPVLNNLNNSVAKGIFGKKEK